MRLGLQSSEGLSGWTFNMGAQLGCHWNACTGPLQHGGLRQNLRALTLEVTQHYFCHILLVMRKSLGPAQIQGKGSWAPPLNGKRIKVTLSKRMYSLPQGCGRWRCGQRAFQAEPQEQERGMLKEWQVAWCSWGGECDKLGERNLKNQFGFCPQRAL